MCRTNRHGPEKGWYRQNWTAPRRRLFHCLRDVVIHRAPLHAAGRQLELNRPLSRKWCTSMRTPLKRFRDWAKQEEEAATSSWCDVMAELRRREMQCRTAIPCRKQTAPTVYTDMANSCAGYTLYIEWLGSIYGMWTDRGSDIKVGSVRRSIAKFRGQSSSAEQYTGPDLNRS